MNDQDQRYRVACDVGGTFTDVVLHDETTGDIHIEKRLTTPSDPSRGALAGLRAFEAVDASHVARTHRIAHATTLVANTVIERKGARTALLTTRGFRDVLELRRHVRVTTYELWEDPPEPLVARRLRLGVDERTYGDGTILKAPVREEIAQIAELLRAEGIESVAIAFLHAYVNPSNELVAAAWLAELLLGVEITTSAGVLPRIKEYERTSTTVVNAYVKPTTRGYLQHFDEGLGAAGYGAPLRIMLSTGGIASAETAGAFPVRLIESGPVAGAIVGRHFAELLGEPEVISFDMGGTTAKACLIRDGALPITDQLEVARSRRFTKSSGFPVAVPAVDMIEIGAGGGSIAFINALDLVQVGPESAGADPGPACYGQGGERPTVSDADVVLGYLDPARFAGGRMTLDVEAAERALRDHLGRHTGRDLFSAAWTVRNVVDEAMAAAVRMHASERGGTPDRALLVAFGGAGPMHADHLARKLSMRRILVPLRAGVLSALGLLIAPAAFDLARTIKTPLARLREADAEAVFAELAAEIEATLRQIDTNSAIEYTRSADIGYIGQGYQVTVPLDDAPLDGDVLWDRFARVYRDKYGYFYDDVPGEVVDLRLNGQLAMAAPTLRAADPPTGATATPSERQAYSAVAGEVIAFAVHDRERLVPGMRIEGPAIIEEASTTTVIDSDAGLEVDELGSLLITLGEETTR